MKSTKHGHAVASFFDGWAVDGHAEGMERGHKARAEEALRAMSLAAGQNVLDLGCGNGWATRWMHEVVSEGGGAAVGVDFSPEMVRNARQVVAETPSLRFVCTDFMGLAFGEDSFDHIFSMEAIYYASDVPGALGELFRVLKPGGRVTLCMDFYAENPYCHGWPEMLDLAMQLFTEAQWLEIMRAAGFSEVRSFRCYDARPVSVDLDPTEAEELRHFREEIGSLTVQGCKGA